MTNRGYGWWVTRLIIHNRDRDLKSMYKEAIRARHRHAQD